MIAWIGSCSTRSFRSGITREGFGCGGGAGKTTATRELDNTHLMRLAGRFARRVKAWGAANGVPVIFCKAGQRKHRIAEEYLATHEVETGVFLVLAAKAPAPVWKVKRSAAGRIVNIERRSEYVNHYSFHIMDPTWGHVTIKMSGHPPFGAQIILNGHEYVARQAEAAGIGFTRPATASPRSPTPRAWLGSQMPCPQDAAVGRLSQVFDGGSTARACASGLTSTSNTSSGFPLRLFAIYQVEYSRNLVFATGRGCSGCSTPWSTGPAPGWTCPRSAPFSAPRGALPQTRPEFLAPSRPRSRHLARPDRVQAPLRAPDRQGLHQRRTRASLRGDRASHQPNSVRPHDRQVPRDHDPTDRHGRTVHHMLWTASILGFLADGILDQLPAGSTLGATRIGGVDLNMKRMRAALRRRARPRSSPAWIHRRRLHRQGPRDYRHTPTPIQHPPSGLRPAQTTRLTTRRQARTHAPLPRPGAGRAHHRCTAHPPRPGHRPAPRRGAQPPNGTQTSALDTCRP